jgi:tetratricopeptide (TPR) repeat protein
VVELNKTALAIYPDINHRIVQKGTALTVRNQKDYNVAQSILKRIPARSNGAIWLKWQSAIYLSLINKNKEAINLLSQIADTSSASLNSHHINMAMARTYYQMGNLEKAKEIYAKIPQESTYWFEAIEELAWSYHRQNDFATSLAQSKSLVNDTFSPIVGSETFYLHALSQLKICEFKGVFKTIELFKKAHKSRLSAMKEYVTSNRQGYVDLIDAQWNSEVRKNKLEFGARTLPRWFDRDDSIQMLVQRLRVIDQESRKLDQILEIDINSLSASLTSVMQSQKNQARLTLLSSTKMMAQAELGEIKRTTQGMHLIEAEITQRMHVIGQNTKMKKFADRNDDELLFPDDENDVWLDEIGNYQVKAGGCDFKGEKI